jgi:hypothetical protein
MEEGEEMKYEYDIVIDRKTRDKYDIQIEGITMESEYLPRIGERISIADHIIGTNDTFDLTCDSDLELEVVGVRYWKDLEDNDFEIYILCKVVEYIEFYSFKKDSK